MHDGTVTGSKDEVENNFKALVQTKYDAKKHSKALTASDLPGNEGQPPTKKLKRAASDASNSSSTSGSSEAAPMERVASTTNAKAKSKAKAKAKASKGGRSEVQDLTCEDGDKDTPQTKAEATFLQQCFF